jgi:hypothetical protein
LVPVSIPSVWADINVIMKKGINGVERSRSTDSYSCTISQQDIAATDSIAAKYQPTIIDSNSSSTIQSADIYSSPRGDDFPATLTTVEGDMSAD